MTINRPSPQAASAINATPKKANTTEPSDSNSRWKAVILAYFLLRLSLGMMFAQRNRRWDARLGSAATSAWFGADAAPAYDAVYFAEAAAKLPASIRIGIIV